VDVLERRRGKVAEASSFVCPRCPAFFICGPVADPSKKILIDLTGRPSSRRLTS
jgi:hypothetical protein